MSIYILAFLFCMILGRVMLYNNGTESVIYRQKKLYLIMVTLLLGLISGFRSTSVGYDTNSYSMIFDDVWVGSVDEIIDSVNRIEPGFVLWCGLIKTLGGNFQWLLITTSIFVVGSFCVFVYRHSKSALWSIFVLFCFQYYYSSFDIIRHFMATSFLLLGYKYVEERKIIPFLLFIIMGSFFHKIAFVFALYYFVPLLKWNRISFIVFVILALILNVFVSNFSVELSLLLGKGDYTQMHDSIQWIGAYSGGEKTFILFLVLSSIMYFVYRINKQRNRVSESINNISLTFCFLITMFAFFFINALMMTRFIMTSSAFIAIAIPNLLIADGKRKIDDKKIKNIARWVILIALAYHAFLLLTNWQNVVPYMPYWQKNHII